MSIRIEEAYNDCLERMISGETLESCLSSYPEYTDELYAMLCTAYDIKRKASSIQPRPEFKYWARARLQDAQYYGRLPQTQGKQRSQIFGLRPKLAISLVALLIFIIASSGTVAASAEAMPDEPLYPVKLAVEQARITLATSDAEKVEIYAQLTEKRAQEIATMTTKGDTEKVLAISEVLSRQLQQLEEKLAKIEAEEEAATSVAAASEAVSAAPSAVSDRTLPITTIVPQTPQAPGTAAAKSAAIDNATAQNETVDTKRSTADSKQSKEFNKRAAAIVKARETVSSTTAKSLTILQEARDKASESLKPSLNNVIDQTKNTNKRAQVKSTDNSLIKQNTHNAAGKDNDGNSEKPVGNPSSKWPDAEKVSPGKLKDNGNFDIDQKAVR